MDDDNRITLVLVDTCAFRDANSDFPGITKNLLPAFFSAIEDKGIILLTHPILESELHKHIEDSGLNRDYEALISHLRKCNDVLNHLGYVDESLFSKIRNFNIKDMLFDTYQNYYQNAIRREYGDPASVFALYFSGKPPFSVSGKKKNEFPDAFVFNAAKKYIGEHPNDVLLIVSKDNDWITAFREVENIIFCNSISEALTKINNIDSILSPEMLQQIFRGAYDEILSEAKIHVECECFELDDYETFNDLEINSIEINSINDNFTPLKISRDNILLSTEICVKVSGYAEVFDEYNSIWDSVDHEYFYKSYADIDFTDAEVTVECEILISFDFDCPEGTAQVINFKLLNQGNLCINCQDAIITEIDEDEMARRGLREDMGYPRRKNHKSRFHS